MSNLKISQLRQLIGKASFAAKVDRHTANSLLDELSSAQAGGVERLRSPAEPALSCEEIRKWWMSDNDLEDCDMCKLDDFTKVVRAVEARCAARAQEPAAAEPVESIEECAEIIHSLITNIRAHGLYSQESTLGFLEQAYFCLKPANSPFVKAAPTTKAEPAPIEMNDALRKFIEGMSVSVDVSTGDHDAGNRYFGTVTIVMESEADKHGVILLVQEPEPNFKAAPADGLDADMFWNDDDPEKQHNSIDEFLNYEICNGVLSIGDTLTLQRGYRLPNITIRVVAIDDNACEAEYEVIDAAMAAQAQKVGAA